MKDKNFSLPHRPRRLRRGPLLRNAVADVRLSPTDLILPLFVADIPDPKPIASMPEVSQLPVRDAIETIRELAGRGLTQFMLFGVTPRKHKDASGKYAASPDAPVNRTLQAVRDAGLDVLLYADLCFCEYTDHGHCGTLMSGDNKWIVDNDRTLEMLGRVACTQAKCGADVVAPSGMMDGQVGAIRAALDQAGRSDVSILSYSIKYASSFYGPFREAGEGGMKFGDRCGYQMDYRRAREWRTELEADLAQGADMVMVKPAAAYLDILQQVRQATSVPVAAYHVSGEYAMLHAAAQRGWIDLKAAVLETTHGIKRAGADLILTYLRPNCWSGFERVLLKWVPLVGRLRQTSAGLKTGDTGLEDATSGTRCDQGSMMLPSLRQRLIIGAAIALATLVFVIIEPHLRAADGSGGISLMSAGIGVAAATGLVSLAGLPALLLGAFASASGNPMAGVFASAVALTVLAGVGGSINQWMWHANLPADYGKLLIELVIWQTGVVVMLLVIQTLRSPLRTSIPALAFNDHLGVDTRIRFPQTQALGAGLFAAAVGGVLSYVLIRNTQIGQVIGSLILAFALGSMLAQFVFPQTNPIGILFSPAVVAAVSYGYVLFNYPSHDAVLAAWYTRQLPGTALALPIFYASAGIAGCAIGVGLAQGLNTTNEMGGG